MSQPRRSPEQQAALVAQRRSSGLSAFAFARKHGLAPANLARWAAHLPPPATAERALTFVRLETAPRSTALVVEAGSARVGVEPGFDPLLLRAMEELGSALGATVVEAMKQDAMATCQVLSTDATGAAIQPEPHPQKRKQACKKGHFFVVVADADHVLFSYTERHTQDAVKKLFHGFRGLLQSDASSVYHLLEREPPRDEEVGRTGCSTAATCTPKRPRRCSACWRRLSWQGHLPPTGRAARGVQPDGHHLPAASVAPAQGGRCGRPVGRRGRRGTRRGRQTGDA